MRNVYRLILGLLLVFLLAACASMSTPQTVRESMVVVSEQATAMVSTANELYLSGIIDKEQHKQFLEDAQEVNQALEDTRALVESGSEDAARDRLQLARTGLTRLKSELEEAQNE